jgi:hypothetical protein
MIWIGLLLAAVAVLEITKNMPKLAFILICFILGFAININTLNMDQFIVRYNVSRVMAGAHETFETDLDAGYLTSLSYDAVPKLGELFNNPEIQGSLRNEIGGVLACKKAMMAGQKDRSWVSTHYSRERAISVLQDLAKELDQYPVSYDSDRYTWFVEVNGDLRPCTSYEPPPFD